MRAGRMIVTNHSTKAIDLLLPELEQGLFDQSWRIRLSSVQLVGELLFRLSGISGKAEMDEDEGKEEEDTTYHSNSEAARKLLEVLGRERRDKVLAALYILRQDSAGQVRMFTIGVWKALVANTPKTVRDMLPALSMYSHAVVSGHAAHFLCSAPRHSFACSAGRGAERDDSTNSRRALSQTGRSYSCKCHPTRSSVYSAKFLFRAILSPSCSKHRKVPCQQSKGAAWPLPRCSRVRPSHSWKDSTCSLLDHQVYLLTFL